MLSRIWLIIRCDSEPGELHLHAAKLELLTVDTIVPTQLAVIERVVKVCHDAFVVQECVIHYLAVPLHHLGNLICPLGVGIT